MSARPARRVVFGNEARRAILHGAAMLADVVASTLGPAGRAVMIDRPPGAPLLSRNGHAIARLVHLEDPLENLGVRALREVAWRTSDDVGDGTTTAMILTRALMAEGTKAALSGLDPRAFQRGVDLAIETVVAELEARSRRAPSKADLARVGTLAAAGDDELGPMLAEAVGRVGAEGFVLIEEGSGRACELEIRDGMHYDKGFVSARFATDEAETRVELDEPYLLMSLGRITDLSAIVPALNAFAKSGRPLVVIAEEVAGEALATLVVNKARAGVAVAAALAPGAGAWRRPMLEDVAIATGGQIVGGELGNRLEDLRPEMLGRARRILITRDATTIIGGAGEAAMIDLRARELRAAIEREKYLSYDREQLQQRLARLVSGIAVIRVGGATQSEIKERRERASGAASAVRAAAAGGVLPGGGAALVHAGKALDRLAVESLEQRAAISAVRRALQAPARQIAANVGVDGNAVVARLLECDAPDFGFDVRQRHCGDLIEAGVVDATRIVTTALRNAASTAARIVLSEAAVAPLELPEPA